MKEYSSNQQSFMPNDALQSESLIKTKKLWQTPRINELNSSETSNGPGEKFVDAGSEWSS